MNRSSRTAMRLEDHSIEGGSRHPLVVHVRAGDHYAKRDAARVRDDVAFDAFFPAIRRIGTREIPPLGALTIVLSRLAHFQAIPRTAS